MVIRRLSFRQGDINWYMLHASGVPIMCLGYAFLLCLQRSQFLTRSFILPIISFNGKMSCKLEMWDKFRRLRILNPNRPILIVSFILNFALPLNKRCINDCVGSDLAFHGLQIFKYLVIHLFLVTFTIGKYRSYWQKKNVSCIAKMVHVFCVI